MTDHQPQTLGETALGEVTSRGPDWTFTFGAGRARRILAYVDEEQARLSRRLFAMRVPASRNRSPAKLRRPATWLSSVRVCGNGFTPFWRKASSTAASAA